MRPSPSRATARLCTVSVCLTAAAFFSVPPRRASAAGLRDDFSTYAEGSTGAPRWHALRGEWLLVACETGVAGRARIEARFRCVAGIPGGGIACGLRDAARPGGCHVVRVDPEGLYHDTLDARGEFRGEPWSLLDLALEEKP